MRGSKDSRTSTRVIASILLSLSMAFGGIPTQALAEISAGIGMPDNASKVSEGLNAPSETPTNPSDDEQASGERSQSVREEAISSGLAGRAATEVADGASEGDGQAERARLLFIASLEALAEQSKLPDGSAMLEAYGEATDSPETSGIFSAIARKLGLDCVIVKSEADDTTWNLVAIGDVWYHVDVWSAAQGMSDRAADPDVLDELTDLWLLVGGDAISSYDDSHASWQIVEDDVSPGDVVVSPNNYEMGDETGEPSQAATFNSVTTPDDAATRGLTAQATTKLGLYVWTSRDKEGKDKTTARIGDYVYLHYDIIDQDYNKLDPSTVGWNNYIVNESFYDPNGRFHEGYSYTNSRGNWIRTLIRDSPSSPGTWKGVVSISGDFSISTTEEFEVYDTPIQITSHPSDASVRDGQSATFSVAASGTNLRYQWYYTDLSGSSHRITGANSASYTVKASATNNGYGYYCVVSNHGNAAVSSRAGKLTTTATYTITFNANGGTGAPAAQTKTHGVALTLRNTRPSRTGYTFLGWSASSNAAKATYAPGASFTTDANTTLYAVWDGATYTVTFNPNGGSVNQTSKTVKRDEAYGALPTPTRSGYRFDGWYTGASGGTKVTSETTVKLSSNQTLYAHWEIFTGASGVWGTCPWEIGTDGVLVIHPGNAGTAPDSEIALSYWWEYARQVTITGIRCVEENGKKVVLNPNSNFIFSDYAGGFDSVKFIDMSGIDSSKVTRALEAFRGCSAIEELDFSTWDMTSVARTDNMFHDCASLKRITVNSTFNTGLPYGFPAATSSNGRWWSVAAQSWFTVDEIAANRNGVADTYSAYEIIDRGLCGTCPWELDASGTLSISTGTLASGTSNADWPWNSYRDQIVKIRFLGAVKSGRWLGYIFSGCKSLVSVESAELFDLSSATWMKSMFSSDQALTEIDVSSWDISSVTNMDGLFYGCASLRNLDVSNWNTSAVTDMTQAFSGCHALSTLDVSKWNTNRVTKMRTLFNGCSSLKEIDISRWDTSSVTDMSHMFNECKSLALLDISKWDTSSVTDMRALFMNCGSLRALDVSRWNTSSVRDMGYLFCGCSSLTSLDLSNLSTGSATRMNSMFYGCYSLTVLDLSSFDTRKVTDYESIFTYLSYNKPLASFSIGSLYTIPAFPRHMYVGGMWWSTRDEIWCSVEEILASRIGIADRYIGEGATPEVMDLSKATIVSIPDERYTGDEHVPNPIISLGSQKLTNDVDYSLSYSANVNAGTACVTAEGKGDCSGTKTATFKIMPAIISDANMSKIADQSYTGSAIEPNVSMTFGGKTLAKGTDYTLTYANNVNVGTATVTIAGKGNFTGERIITFDIVSSDPGGTSFDTAIPTAFNTPYEATISRYVARYYRFTIPSGGRITYEVTTNMQSFPIEVFDATRHSLEKGSFARPSNVSSGDWECANAFNLTSGTYYVKVGGEYGSIGSYRFTLSCVSACETIPEPSGGSNNTTSTATKIALGETYFGQIALNDDIDYYTFALPVDTTINLLGSFVIGYDDIDIVLYDASGSSRLEASSIWNTALRFSRSGPSQSYAPDGVCELSAGTYYLMIAGHQGVGSCSYSFTLDVVGISEPKSLSSCTVTLSPSSYVYDGTQKTPSVTVRDGSKTLSDGTDYTVNVPRGRTDAGSYTYTVTGKGDYEGTNSATLTITPQSLSFCTLTLSPSSYVYDGTQKTPTVTVRDGSKTLSDGTDYTVNVPSGRTNVGSYTYTVTGKDNYQDAKSVSFTISPRAKSDFEWGADNWSFKNSSYTGDFKNNRYIDQINNTYRDALAKSLTPADYDIVFTDRVINGTYITGWINERWEGSCYGMASLALLSKEGLLPYANYKYGATSLYELTRPSDDINVSSLITYYQMIQVRDIIWNEKVDTRKRSAEQNIKALISTLDSHSTALVCYRQDNWGHAVLAYGYEYGSWTKNGVTYDARILICDPNESPARYENSDLYFNSRTYSWAIPKYSLVKSSNGAFIEYVGADVDKINEGGYLGGSASSQVGNYVARLDTFAVADDRSVTKVQESSGRYVSKASDPGEIEEDYSFVYAAEREGKATPGYNLYDAESAYKISQSTPTDLAVVMRYEDYLMSAGSIAGENAVFDNNGYVEVNGQSADYTLSITSNEECPTDWYGMKASGSGADNASLEVVDRGYVLKSDNMQQVALEAHNKDHYVQTSFSTSCDEVYIYEIDADTIGVSVDMDGNGSYETVIADETTEGASSGATVRAVLDAIDSVPQVSTLKLSDEGTVQIARELYDSLTEEQKSEVGDAKLQRLIEAEERIAQLKKSDQIITASDLTVVLGNTVSLGATTSGDGMLTYESLNTKVATVNIAGVVTPVSVGTAKVTIAAAETENYMAATKTVTVTVTQGGSQTPKVAYRTHVQSDGWQGYVGDGATSGTSGRSLRLEGINIKLEGADGGIQYRTHIQNVGWEGGWKANGEMSGTSGQSLRLEAIQIELTGDVAKTHDVWYRVHAQNVGWMGWAKNGAMAGTAAHAYRLEAIQIRLVAKGGAAPGSPSRAYLDGAGYLSGVPDAESGVLYRTHVQNEGWQNWMRDGEMAGTTGKSYRLEGINLRLGGAISGGIRYRTHIQSVGWQDWKADGEMSGTSGQSLRLEAIRVELTGDAAKTHDVWYRVHAQNFGWLGWARDGESSGTAGYAYRLEGIEVRVLPKGATPPGSTKAIFWQGGRATDGAGRTSA